MCTLSPQTSVGQLVAESPARTRVLEGLGLQAGHGNHRTLQEVCTEKDLDARSVLATLVAAEGLSVVSAPLTAKPGLTTLSLSELCDHIVGTDHAHLEAELTRLSGLAQRVALLHGAAHAWLRPLRTTFEELAEGMRTHLLKEEVMLFPAIRPLEAGRVADAPFGSHLRAPVELLEHEHMEIGTALTRLRDLSHGFTAPGDACPAFQALLSGLAGLEQDLRRHIRRENDILFPRVLAQFGPVGA